MLQKYHITVMIYLTSVQYIKHRMQITQKRLEYDLTTNSMKFMQQTTPLSEGDGSVCNQYLLQSTYLINSLKVKGNVKNVHLRYKHKLADIYTIHWCELHQRLSAVAHVTCQSSTASVCWPHGFSSKHCGIVFVDFIVTAFRPELLRRPHML